MTLLSERMEGVGGVGGVGRGMYLVAE